MEYYKLLNLSREPFSNSPDPELFFRSSRHAECLQKLEIAIRLRRGLCVVRGDVGTGKTTVCRHLLRSLSGDDSLEMHMILDPSFDNELEMLAAINAMFSGADRAATCTNAWQHKEMIKDYLYHQGVEQKKTVILVVDEGQKLTTSGAEILRELLNFETNQEKLLQIVIFAQSEIDQLLEKMPNFADRIGLYHRLLPLSLKDTGFFIKYRLERSCAGNLDLEKVYFTRSAIGTVHSLTGGYPRKIINLCHNIILTLIIKGKYRVTPEIVQNASNSLQSLNKTSSFRRFTWRAGAAAAVIVMLWVFTPVIPNPADMAVIDRTIQDHSVPEKSTSMFKTQVQWGHYLPTEKPGFELLDHYDLTFAEKKAAATVEKPVSGDDPDTKPAEVDDFNTPQSLGFVIVHSYESLWDILERIYGFGTESLLHEIIKANPAIVDPDIIYRGMRINILATSPVSPDNDKRYWITISMHRQLDQAYTHIMKNLEHLRVLCTWDPADGLRYHVVTYDSFSTMDKAQKALQVLPRELYDRAEILDLEGMYFFS